MRSRLASTLAIAVASSAFIAVSAFTPASSAEPGICQGKSATITASGTSVSGTPGDDVIVLDGVTGDTPGLRIDAQAGNDTVCVRGQEARVAVDLAAGDDSVIVDETPAALPLALDVQLGNGSDEVATAGGDDTLVSEPADITEQEPVDGADTLSTGSGDDLIKTSSPMTGAELGPGDDEIILITPQGGPIDAGSGRDRLHLASRIARVNLPDEEYGSSDDGRRTDRLEGIQDIRVQADETLVEADAQNNVIELASNCITKVDGARGDDTIMQFRGSALLDVDDGFVDGSCFESLTHRYRGGEGDDLLIGRSRHQDKLLGGPGADVIRGKGGTGLQDRLRGGPGSDQLIGGSVGDKIFGGSGPDVLKGKDGKDTLYGSPGKDRLVGNQGKDTAIGGSGNDLLKGGKDNDRLFGGRGRDKAVGATGNDRCGAEREFSCER